MDADRDWLAQQIAERLRYYASFTSVGLDWTPPSRRPVGVASHPSEREETREAPSRPSTGTPGKASGETLEQVSQDLGECTRCRLHSGRRSIVFGVGNRSADLMFVGEGPGYEEDVQGLPFVGPAGQLLTRIIQAIDMQRDEVYIANIVKCRPPGNRDPEPDEMATCLPFLERQIRSVNPRVICTLGRIAAQALLSTQKPLGQIRGQVFSFGDTVLVPTYHPAYLLRNPEKKREAWEDMKLVRRLLHERR